MYNVKDDEVIAAGLIAKGIAINEGLSKAIEENNQLDDDIQLLELADKKRKEVQAEYDKRGLKIRPLVLIQFPNGSEEWIQRVKEHLADMGYSESSGLVASWFSGDHPDNPEQGSHLKILNFITSTRFLLPWKVFIGLGNEDVNIFDGPLLNLSQLTLCDTSMSNMKNGW